MNGPKLVPSVFRPIEAFRAKTSGLLHRVSSTEETAPPSTLPATTAVPTASASAADAAAAAALATSAAPAGPSATVAPSPTVAATNAMTTVASSATEVSITKPPPEQKHVEQPVAGTIKTTTAGAGTEAPPLASVSTGAPTSSQSQAPPSTAAQAPTATSAAVAPSLGARSTAAPQPTAAPSSGISTVVVHQQPTTAKLAASPAGALEPSAKPTVALAASTSLKPPTTAEASHSGVQPSTVPSETTPGKMKPTTGPLPTTTTAETHGQRENQETEGPRTTVKPPLNASPSDKQVVVTTQKGPTNAPPEATAAASLSPTTTTSGPEASEMNVYKFSLDNKENQEFHEVCKRLMNMASLGNGDCVLTWQNVSSKVKFTDVSLSGTVKPSLAEQHYEELTNKKPNDNKTLIAILASCGALLIMIIILTVCASHHRKPYNETQQHLTEELHTVENGYHDNPTLEVMEVQPEMQEKKVALNGEFNDSWIVPIDNLLKEDMPDEEDTHL